MPFLSRGIGIVLLTALSCAAFSYQQDIAAAIQNPVPIAFTQKMWLSHSYAYRDAFVFNPKTHRWHAYNHRGRLIKSGKASGGANYCRDIKRACRTPVGSYRILSKRGAQCRSSRYPRGRGGAPMPYCMFFSKLYAVHGSYDVPNRNASHGCIRVTPADARWLSQHFLHIGKRVIVKPY